MASEQDQSLKRGVLRQPRAADPGRLEQRPELVSATSSQRGWRETTSETSLIMNLQARGAKAASTSRWLWVSGSNELRPG